MKYLPTALAALALLAGPAHAKTLFTTGAPQLTDAYCNSNDAGGFCNPGFPNPPTLSWTIYTPFVLHQAATLTGVTYSNVFFDPLDFPYLSTNWSIWSASPAATYASGPAFAGSGAGVLADGPAINAGFTDTEVTLGGLSLTLAAGHYYIGLNNSIVPGDVSVYVSAFGDGHSQGSDQAGNFYDTRLPNQALVLTGYVPEPESWALLLAGFGVAGVVMRRRVVATF